MTQKEQRAKRIEEVKAAMLAMVKKHEPHIKEAIMTDDAAIDLFGLGILDAPQDEWDDFIKGFAEGEIMPPEEEIPEEVKVRLKDLRAKRGA